MNSMMLDKNRHSVIIYSPLNQTFLTVQHKRYFEGKRSCTSTL